MSRHVCRQRKLFNNGRMFVDLLQLQNYMARLTLDLLGLLLHLFLHRITLAVIAEGPEQSIPDLDVLSEIALAVSVVTSVESCVEEENVKVKAAVAQAAKKTVDP